MNSIHSIMKIFDYYMASIKAFGSLVPFTLPLGNNGYVVVSKDLLELRFNFLVGTILSNKSCM